MDGLEQIFQAMFNQQTKPKRVEVDEMTQSQQSQDDRMAQIVAVGQNDGMSMGMRNMMDALQLDDPDNKYFWQ